VDKLDVSIKGLDEIEKRLQAVPDKLRRKYLRMALIEGTKPIEEEAQHKVRVGLNAPHLRDAITSKITIGANFSTARVGVDYKKVKHGHLLELGTDPHMIGRRQHRGGRKYPFMRPAFDAKGDNSLDRMLTILAKGIEKEA
jgi:HK97 gp10 family phage protein